MQVGQYHFNGDLVRPLIACGEGHSERLGSGLQTARYGGLTGQGPL